MTSAIAAFQNYVTKMLEVPGMKALVMDEETVRSARGYGVMGRKLWLLMFAHL